LKRCFTLQQLSTTASNVPTTLPVPYEFHVAQKVLPSNGRRNAPIRVLLVRLARADRGRNIAADVLFGGVMRLT
jgi:hypothetical protein